MADKITSEQVREALELAQKPIILFDGREVGEPLLFYFDGIAECNWKIGGTDYLVIQFRNLIQDRSSSLHAEIDVKLNKQYILTGIRFNLNSPTGRKSVVKQLVPATNAILDNDWDRVMNLACTKTIEAFRKGEPLVKLEEVELPEIEPYTLYPLLYEYEPHCIVAPGQSCKSYIALYFAILVHLGIDAHGFKATKGNALILDWETSNSRYARRSRAIEKGLNIEGMSYPLYRRMKTSLAHDLQEIHKIVQAENIKLIVIDSLMRALTGGSSEDIAISEFYNALRELEVTSLVIDHTRKEGDMYHGSVVKFNSTRSMFQLETEKNATTGDANVVMVHKKSNDGRILRPIGLTLSFQNNGGGFIDKVIVTGNDISQRSDISAITIKARIQAALRRGARTVPELVTLLNEKDNSVRQVLIRGKGFSFVEIPKLEGAEKAWANMSKETK